MQFRRKAAEFGLIVDERGHQQYEPNGPFMRLLQTHGINVSDLPVFTPRPVGSSKLKLWMCKCLPPFRVRVARAEFSATCNYCGQEYFQPDREQDGKSVGSSLARDAKRKVRKQEAVA